MMNTISCIYIYIYIYVEALIEATIELSDSIPILLLVVPSARHRRLAANQFFWNILYTGGV